MITRIGTVALYVDDPQAAVEFWTERIGFEVRTKRPLGPAGHWIEIAPPGTQSCLVLYPKLLLPDWDHRKPSIVFDCDDVAATVAALKGRGVTISQEMTEMQWGPFAAFVDTDANEHGLRQAGQARTRAKTTITVCDYATEGLDQAAGAAFARVRIRESFSGDIEGESTVVALQAHGDDGCVRMLSLQQVSGRVGDRRGTFVLQGEEIVENGEIRATWSVAPGSGTGELAGLRGEGCFEGRFGQGSRGTLDYWFE